MRLACAVAVVFACFVAASTGINAAESAAPVGCRWKAIPELKAHLAIPIGWKFKTAASGDALIYEVRPAGRGFENSKALYRLEVRRGTEKTDVVDRARAFIEALRATAVDPPALEEQHISTLTLFSCFVRFAPPANGDGGTAAVSSAANSRTGTIYTVQFDIPENELGIIAPLGNQLFRELKLDDEI